MTSLDLDRAAETFAEASDFTVGVEEEFSILDPETLELMPRFEQLRAAAEGDPLLHEGITGELISSEIEIISGVGSRPARRARTPARAPQAPVRARGGAAAWRWARPAPIRGPTIASSRSSTPSTTAASRRA